MSQGAPLYQGTHANSDPSACFVSVFYNHTIRLSLLLMTDQGGWRKGQGQKQRATRQTGGAIQQTITHSQQAAANHHHLFLHRQGRCGTTDDFTTNFFHFSLFSTALWDLANSRPVHSLMLNSYTINKQTATTTTKRQTQQEGHNIKDKCAPTACNYRPVKMTLSNPNICNYRPVKMTLSNPNIFNYSPVKMTLSDPNMCHYRPVKMTLSDPNMCHYRPVKMTLSNPNI